MYNFCHVYILRLLTGVVLEVVAFILIEVDVVFGRTVSGSESEFSKFWTDVGFLTTGAINFSISFWFSAMILVRSGINFLLRDVSFSSSSSDWIFGDLLGLATQFSTRLVSEVEASNFPETKSATATFFGF